MLVYNDANSYIIDNAAISTVEGLGAPIYTELGAPIYTELGTPIYSDYSLGATYYGLPIVGDVILGEPIKVEKAAEPKKEEAPAKPAEEPKKEEEPAKPAEPEPKKEDPKEEPKEEPKKEEAPAKPAEEPKKEEKPAEALPLPLIISDDQVILNYYALNHANVDPVYLL